MRLVVVYRGVFLYGESGSGKSSLVNAGLMPALAAEGFRADRLRVQPRRGEELVVERIPITEDGATFLPSSFATESDGSSQIVLPVDELRARIAGLPRDEHRPFLVFDQFEELITLFEEAREGDAREDALGLQRRIVDELGELLRDETLPVKLLFGFREDYLAKVTKLLDLHPELVSQSMRLTPPGTDALTRIIRGPFEDHPGHFDRELSPELAERLSTAIERRSASGAISLSEVQIVCLRLWESGDPDELLERRHVRGILEDYLEQSLKRFPEELHDPAVALLSQMVTGSGARNVVSADDLVERVRRDEPDISEERLERTLDALEKETKLVRREQRHDLDLYEISSEFLVPWIGRQREQGVKAREQAELGRQLEEQAQQQRARLMFGFGIFGTFLFLLGVSFGVLALSKWFEARDERDESRSLLTSQDAVRFLESDPLLSLRTAHRARNIRETDAAEEALRSALVGLHRRAVLDGHTDIVNSAAFSPDGRRVVTAGSDGTVRLWDAATGKQTASLGNPQPGDPAIYSVAVSPDGKRIVSAGANGIVRLWNAGTGEQVASLGNPKLGDPAVFSAAFSPDGKRIVTAAGETARIWDSTTRKLVRELEGHNDSVLTAAFGPGGRRVVTSGADGTARVWDVATGNVVSVLRGHEGPIVGASFDPDGKRVVTAGVDGDARVWDVATEAVLRVLSRHRETVTSASFSRDGALIVTTGGSDETARVWDGETGKVVSVLRGHEESVVAASFSPDDTRIVTASEDRTARVWDSVAEVGIVVDLGRRVASAAIGSDGRFIAAVGEDGTARVWSGGSRSSLGGSLGKGIQSVGFSRDGRRLVSAGVDGTVRIWDVARGRTETVFPRQEALVSASFDPDGARLVTSGAGAILWDLDAGIQAVLIEPNRLSPVVSAAFSSDGNRLVTVRTEDVIIWNARTGADLGSLPLPPHPVELVSAAFGPAGLLITVRGKTATVWTAQEPENARPVTVLSGHTGPINGAVFSPDGKFVLTSSDDRTARVWLARSGRLLAVLRGHTDSVRAAEFSAGSASVVTASADGIVRRFTCESCLPIEDLLRLGNWTQEELTGENDS